MKCQILFSVKNKKNNIKISADFFFTQHAKC